MTTPNGKKYTPNLLDVVMLTQDHFQMDRCAALCNERYACTSYWYSVVEVLDDPVSGRSGNCFLLSSPFGDGRTGNNFLRVLELLKMFVAFFTVVCGHAMSGDIVLAGLSWEGGEAISLNRSTAHKKNQTCCRGRGILDHVSSCVRLCTTFKVENVDSMTLHFSPLYLMVDHPFSRRPVPARDRRAHAGLF